MVGIIILTAVFTCFLLGLKLQENESYYGLINSLSLSLSLSSPNLFGVLQVRTFKPQLIAVRNESLVDELKEALVDVKEKPEIIPGEQGVVEAE
jgi:hypothetical protein